MGLDSLPKDVTADLIWELNTLCMGILTDDHVHNKLTSGELAAENKAQYLREISLKQDRRKRATEHQLETGGILHSPRNALKVAETTKNSFFLATAFQTAEDILILRGDLAELKQTLPDLERELDKAIGQAEEMRKQGKITQRIYRGIKSARELAQADQVIDVNEAFKRAGGRER